MQRLIVAIVVALAMIVAYMALTSGMRTRSEVTFTTLQPESVQPQGLRIADVKSTKLRRHVRFHKLDPQTRAMTGPCYRVDNRIIGDNAVIDEIVTGTGHTITRAQNARLCRCGASSTKPFCDGTHARIGFKS
mgnify:CR=1 FL=1